MRISDWSSDVCSSDLAFRHDNARLGIDQFRQRVKIVLVIDEVVRAIERVLDGSNGVHAASARRARPSSEATIVSTSRIRATRPSPNIDRKSVGEGKSVSVRVDIGGSRIIKKKKKKKIK